MDSRLLIVCIITLFIKLMTYGSPVLKETTDVQLYHEQEEISKATKARDSFKGHVAPRGIYRHLVPSRTTYDANGGKRVKRSTGFPCRKVVITKKHECFDKPLMYYVCKNTTTGGCFHTVAKRSYGACETVYESLYSSKCNTSIAIPRNCKCAESH